MVVEGKKVEAELQKENSRAREVTHECVMRNVERTFEAKSLVVSLSSHHHVRARSHNVRLVWSLYSSPFAHSKAFRALSGCSLRPYPP